MARLDLIAKRLMRLEQVAKARPQGPICGCRSTIIYHCPEELEAIIRGMPECRVHIVPGPFYFFWRIESIWPPIAESARKYCVCAPQPLREYEEGKRPKPTREELTEYSNRKARQDHNEDNRLFQLSSKRLDEFIACYQEALGKSQSLGSNNVEEKRRLWEWVQNGGNSGLPSPRAGDRQNWLVWGERAFDDEAGSSLISKP